MSKFCLSISSKSRRALAQEQRPRANQDASILLRSEPNTLTRAACVRTYPQTIGRDQCTELSESNWTNVSVQCWKECYWKYGGQDAIWERLSTLSVRRVSWRARAARVKYLRDGCLWVGRARRAEGCSCKIALPIPHVVHQSTPQVLFSLSAASHKPLCACILREASESENRNRGVVHQSTPPHHFNTRGFPCHLY